MGIRISTESAGTDRAEPEEIRDQVYYEGIADLEFEPVGTAGWAPGSYEILGEFWQTESATLTIDYSTAAELPEPRLFWPVGIGFAWLAGVGIRRRRVASRFRMRFYPQAS